MKRSLFFIAALMSPVAVFALEFEDVTAQFSDAPFSRGDAAGISVLVDLGAVQGYPDGTFQPERNLNRAEFLKIAFLSAPSIIVNDGNSDDCFPDVKTEDWFSRYVCLAKERGVVSGYPDGLFHPERLVNYVEALKMLSELYDYETTELSGEEWYVRYVNAANAHKTALPVSILPGDALRRGEMARLAAAFRAEHEGQLEAYRAFERGRVLSSSSSFSSSSSVSSVASSSESSSSSLSSSSSSSAQTSGLYPAVSRFLVTGETSLPIFDGVFTSYDEDSDLRAVNVNLRREVNALESLILVDDKGAELATLKLSIVNNNDDKKWEVIIPDGSGALRFTKDVPKTLGIRAKLKNRDNGGVANELVELDTWSIQTRGVVTSNSKQIVPVSTHFPMHQTAHARITGVKNMLTTTASVTEGSAREIARIKFEGKTVTGASLTILSVDFILDTTNASVSNLRIGGPTVAVQGDCSVERLGTTRVSCAVLPEAYKIVGSGGLILSLYADVDLSDSAQTGSLQATFEGTGKLGQNGSIRWNDATGSYNWIEEGTMLQNGPVWTVTK